MLPLNESRLLMAQCLIDGCWTGEPVNPITNPATGDIIRHVPMMGAAETIDAINAADRALPGWSAMTAKARSAILKRWFDLMLRHRDDLALILTSEQGKPLAEGRGEIDYAASFIEWFAEEGKRLYGETIPSTRPDARISVIRQPIGVVAAITPWNFPAAMITRKVAPALAVGCTVVVKPAPETPLTALALAALAVEAGVPAGVLNVITGDAAAIGRVLTSHPTVRALTFTGSTGVGKLLMRDCADTVKKVSLELGGNAPFIVFDDADVEAAADGAMLSKFRNMGQTCVCANRLYVQRGVADRFVRALKARIASLVVGPGLNPDANQGPLINKAAIDKVEAHIADAISKGATVAIGGKRHALGGTFFEPTLLVDVTAQMRISDEETFGPVAPIYLFDEEHEAIAQANATPFGLAAYFYSRDLGRVTRVSEALQFGMVGVNTGIIATEVAPFGGIKQSGLGREGGRHGLDEFSEAKYILTAGISL